MKRPDKSKAARHDSEHAVKRGQVYRVTTDPAKMSDQWTRIEDTGPPPPKVLASLKYIRGANLQAWLDLTTRQRALAFVFEDRTTDAANQYSTAAEMYADRAALNWSSVQHFKRQYLTARHMLKDAETADVLNDTAARKAMTAFVADLGHVRTFFEGATTRGNVDTLQAATDAENALATRLAATV